MIRVHVHRLDFGAQPAVGLEVPEDDELADPHHLAVQLGHQDRAATRVDVTQRGAVRTEISGILRARRPPGDRAEQQQLDDTAEVALVRLPDDEARGCHGRSLLTQAIVPSPARPQ